MPAKRAPADGGLRPIFFDRLKRNCQWTPIETWAIRGGVPDAEYCFSNGSQGWVEFKRTETLAIRFRPLQPAWIDRRARYGGRVWVAVRRRPKRMLKDDLWLIPGSAVLALQVQGLEGVEGVSYRWHGGPAKWDWDAIREIMGG